MKPLSSFFIAPPGDKTYCTGIQDAEEEVVEKEVNQSTEPEEQNVWDNVYTGDKPIFLRMDDKDGEKNNLIRRTKELGIWQKGMRRSDLEKVRLHHLICFTYIYDLVSNNDMFSMHPFIYYLRCWKSIGSRSVVVGNNIRMHLSSISRNRASLVNVKWHLLPSARRTLLLRRPNKSRSLRKRKLQ